MDELGSVGVLGTPNHEIRLAQDIDIVYNHTALWSVVAHTQRAVAESEMKSKLVGAAEGARGCENPEHR